jgi:hypothetical protein
LIVGVSSQKGKEIQEEVLNKEEWKIVTETLLDFFQERQEKILSYPTRLFRLDSIEKTRNCWVPRVVGVDGLHHAR